MLNKFSLVVTQKQLTNIFGDSKYDSPAISRNPSPKHIITKTMNQIKLQNTRKNYKNENTVPWNFKSLKAI